MPVLWEESRLRECWHVGMFGWISLWPTLVGIWPRVGVRSLILIYLKVAVQGSLGEQGSCREPKCVLNHVINLKPPEVNPKPSHRDVEVLADHRHVLAAPLSLPGKVLCWQAPHSHGGVFLPSHPGYSPVHHPRSPISPLCPEQLICCLEWRAWSQTETLMFPLIGISVLLHSLNWPLLLINEDPKVHVLKTLLS